MKRIPAALLAILALVLAVTNPVTAQSPGAADMVYVRVGATEPAISRPVGGLHKEDFKVSEDNTAQNIAYFSPDSTPLLVGLLWDTGTDLKDDVKAKVAPTLIKGSAKDDEFFVVESGNIPLNEAVLRTLNDLSQRGNNKRRVLVLITSKNPEPHSFSIVRELLKKENIQLYVIALLAPPTSLNDSTRQILRDLAELSGGRAFFPTFLSDLGFMNSEIMAELKNQYLIGYRSTNRAIDGKWRRIKVTAEYREFPNKKAIKLTIHGRMGYYAPTTGK